MISPTAGPTVGTVADAFGLQPWQVEKLLTEVRGQEADAPQWRKLGAIGAALGVLVVFGLCFGAWRSATSPAASASVADGPSALTPGGPSALPNYSGASFNPQPRADSAATSASYIDGSSLQRHHGRGPMMADAGTEQAVIPRERYAKTDASDLNNARNKASRIGTGSSDYGRGPRTGTNHATPIER
ncbi:hypothetical protein EON82_14680 [bacterium]|nr:MAG: hypothetical protein EON82_14680 [bacterium]